MATIGRNMQFHIRINIFSNQLCCSTTFSSFSFQFLFSSCARQFLSSPFNFKYGEHPLIQFSIIYMLQLIHCRQISYDPCLLYSVHLQGIVQSYTFQYGEKVVIFVQSAYWNEEGRNKQSSLLRYDAVLIGTFSETLAADIFKEFQDE